MEPHGASKTAQDLREMGPWVLMILVLILPLVMGLDISLGGAEDDRRFGYAALALFAVTAAGSIRWGRQPRVMAVFCIALAVLYAGLAASALAISAMELTLPVLVILAIMLGALGAAAAMFRKRASVPRGMVGAALMDYGPALRSRYREAHHCVCIIDGQSCTPDRVSTRSFNFGQHWRTEGIVEVGYHVELPRAYLFDFLSKELPEFIADCKQHPDPDDEVDRVLRGANWPSAREVMDRPELAHFFAEYFADDLLAHWFGTGAPDREPGYVLNTVDRVEVGEERVLTFEGKGRTTDIPVRYQDV